MKKKFAVLLSALVLAVGLMGCAYSEMETTYDEEAEVLPPSMFVAVEDGLRYRIVYHKETKVMYAISNGGYNQDTFTLLVDANGDPLLYKGE